MPAAKAPIAVANHMMALFFVASLLAFLGESWKMAVRLTAQYDDSRNASTNFPATKTGREVAT